MNHWWIGLIAAGAAVLLLYVLAPGVFLRLGLLLYPKDHEKRAEFLGELHYVPRRGRSQWVAGQLSLCILEGPSARLERRRQALTPKIDRITRREMRIIREYSRTTLGSVSNEELFVVKKYNPVLWERLMNPDSFGLMQAV